MKLNIFNFRRLCWGGNAFKAGHTSEVSSQNSTLLSVFSNIFCSTAYSKVVIQDTTEALPNSIINAYLRGNCICEFC